MITQDKVSNPTQFYTWEKYNCSYEVQNQNGNNTPLVLIHPIGVGLSRKFWINFCSEWEKESNSSHDLNPIYNPDLLGCGDGDMPVMAYNPDFWAKQLKYFIENIVQNNAKKSVILVVQGALFTVALELVKIAPDLVEKIIISAPPPYNLINENNPEWRKKLAWTIFSSPFGNLFYRYARTEKFLRNFSIRRLFYSSEAVDSQWLNPLISGSRNMASRYAVFSFLAGFWRKNYSDEIKSIQQPTLIVLGAATTSVSKRGITKTTNEWLADYLGAFPQSQGKIISGRNVLPYESAVEFVSAVKSFLVNS
ncbi:alpha/beta fold hydrolase [Brunnivagina elsteri]|uniref:Alpha/beta hydrolase n=1 Tax=Brunnivagina elsteri CCALA 953 TaxID=987040 RepID=A0A2A2TG48_9CYAN|nr:alpha/beta hydrolase [Calothrix elsteri]PAX52714.1 alpha/beta hydrolase [Calothrix elsteri CCALA 953]